MTTKVNLPPGCYGTEMADGTKYTAKKPGGTIDMADRHARAMDKSQHAGIGLLSSTHSFRLATKNGRHCPACGFSAQCWSKSCPRCDQPTVPDAVEAA
jgi:lipopolysaccharide biosynthesis regulator YciM